METKGRLIDIAKDWSSGKFRLTFEVEKDVTSELAALQVGALRINAVKWREKRSLDANAYYWSLVSKIADITDRSNTAVHNQLLADYGQHEIIDGKLTNIIMKDSIDWHEMPYIHLKPTTATKVMDNGELYRVYYVMRGSSEYDTKEMSRLIDGCVQEAKQLDIETMTPAEIERMMSSYEKARKRIN